MRKYLVLAMAVLSSSPAWAAGELSGLRVNLSIADERKDMVMPHWENWKLKDAPSDTRQFGNLKITVEGTGKGLHTEVFKALLEDGVHMALTGITPQIEGKEPGEITMTISGLTPGKHTIATIHSEVRNIIPPKYDILVNDAVVVHNFEPSKRIASDYDAASTYLEVNAVAEKDTVIKIRPAPGSANQNIIMNGFEIDAVDPHKMAIKPLPEDADEHVAPDEALTWTAGKGATAHQLYLGTDAAAVMNATTASPEYKGTLKVAKFPLPKLDTMLTYYWRVDEQESGAAPVKGETWMFRPRTLAFPTAEGYGQYARGGRGGRVIEVTNLEDYNAGQPPIPGSYRAAIEAQGPRVVVFRVSGLIKLTRPCTITNPYITVAGQTAPGEGICLSQFSAGTSAHDVIVRFMHLRVGDFAQRAMDGMGMGGGAESCIIDHCSISWAMDEGTSSRTGKNITFQWNIVSEGLNNSYHYRAADRTQFEQHAFAGSISGNIGSYHHNLLVHCTDRNWSLAGGYDQAGNYGGYLDIRNNVVYNWVGRTTDGGVMQLNYVNNYYKPYSQQPKYAKYLLKLDPVVTSHGTPKYYMVGNILEGIIGEKDDNWKNGGFQNGPQLEAIVRSNEPLYPSYVKTHTAKEVFPLVVANAGAIFPVRDVIDKRLAEEVKTGTVHYTGTFGPQATPRSVDYPGIIDTQTDVKDAVGSPNFPWPAYRSAPAPLDTDHDGIPDAWEIKHGLNPNDLSDSNTKPQADGYTPLEHYLGSLVGEFPDTK